MVPVKFHDTLQTVQLWSENRDIICISRRDVPVVASLKQKMNEKKNLDFYHEQGNSVAHSV